MPRHPPCALDIFIARGQGPPRLYLGIELVFGKKLFAIVIANHPLEHSVVNVRDCDDSNNDYAMRLSRCTR